jgi:fluoroacetyl-CoA thioesterase
MIVERLLREATVELIVTPEMRAAFEGEIVHEVYGTAPMVGHMELAARRVILAAREEGEEGVGYKVDVAHLAPAPVGARVTVTARLRHVEGNRVLCDVEARTARGVIGRGTVTQVLLPIEVLQRRFKDYGGETNG